MFHYKDLVKILILKKQIKDFFKEVKKFNLNDIICIDETSIETF